MDALKVERARGGLLLRCRAQKLVVSVLLLLLVAAGWTAIGSQLEVLQPQSYSDSQRSTLSTATAELERLLGDTSLGSRMRLGERAWTSQEFSAFTAGALDQLGYKTDVVSAQEPNERRVWVLVGVHVGDETAWVPIEATPAPGAVQASLGHVAWGSAGGYADAYLQHDGRVDMAPNLTPIAVVLSPVAAPLSGEDARFLALQSQDPDGEIILYVWEVEGDRRPTTTNRWFYDHVFEQGGSHTLTLTVVDNRGARASAVVSVEVYGNGYESEPSDCGCGG